MARRKEDDECMRSVDDYVCEQPEADSPFG